MYLVKSDRDGMRFYKGDEGSITSNGSKKETKETYENQKG
jgi:hypothetical protein